MGLPLPAPCCPRPYDALARDAIPGAVRGGDGPGPRFAAALVGLRRFLDGRVLWFWLVLLVGAATTIGIWQFASVKIDQAGEARFKAVQHQTAHLLQSRLDRHVQIFQGALALIAAPRESGLPTIAWSRPPGGAGAEGPVDLVWFLPRYARSIPPETPEERGEPLRAGGLRRCIVLRDRKAGARRFHGAGATGRRPRGSARSR